MLVFLDIENIAVSMAYRRTSHFCVHLAFSSIFIANCSQVNQINSAANGSVTKMVNMTINYDYLNSRARSKS